MSQEPEAVVRELFAAWDLAAADAVVALTSPDVVIDATRRIFNPKTYQGHEGVRAMIEETGEVWEDLGAEDLEFIGAPDGRLVVVGRMVATGKGSGVETSQPMAGVWTVRDGRILRWELGFVDRATALEAVGMSEPGRKLR